MPTRSVPPLAAEQFEVAVLDFSDTTDRRHQTLVALQKVAHTEVLMGCHGAGLTLALYLPDRAMLVELVHAMYEFKKLFLNVASKKNLPYYAFDTQPYTNRSKRQRAIVGPVKSFAKQVREAWQVEQHVDPYIVVSGECSFPKPLPLRRLSSSNHSRCYLEYYKGQWRQCFQYGCHI